MPLAFQTDLAAAAWVEDADDGLVSAYGPPGFAAYARLFHAPAGSSRSALVDVEGMPEDEDHRALLAILLELAGGDAPCTCCLWDGFGDVWAAPAIVGADTWPTGDDSERYEHPAFGEEVLRGPRLGLDVLGYLVFAGALRDAGDWGARPLPPQAALFGTARPISVPNLMWPEDREWFVTTHVDLPWTGVAGTVELVRRLRETWPGDTELLPGRPTTVLYDRV